MIESIGIEPDKLYKLKQAPNELLQQKRIQTRQRSSHHTTHPPPTQPRTH